MAKHPGDSRRHKYFQLSSLIAQLDNAAVFSLVGASEPSMGWGRNHTVELAASKVFVKRIPVTDTELDNLFSTKNVYSLPTYYNYGVGSAGFGAFRELATQIKTTNWVLNGEIESFPLLYHYRIVPCSGERAEVDLERHKRYVEYWGGNENIGNYLLDRANASHELVLFLEHMPHGLLPWLQENPDKVHQVLDDLRGTIDFLRQHGVIHFDAHFGNILTDGEQAYLTDFGLVLDRDFDLSDDEHAFFEANTHYDYGEILWCLGYFLYQTYQALPDSDKRWLQKKYGVDEGSQAHELMPHLVDNIEELCADGVIKVNESYLTCIVQYRGVIALMDDFYADLRHNPRKDTKFPHAELRRRLNKSGFVRDTSTNGC